MEVLDRIEKALKKRATFMIKLVIALTAVVVVLVIMKAVGFKMLTIAGILTGAVVAAICLAISWSFEENSKKTAITTAGMAILYIIAYVTASRVLPGIAMVVLVMVLAMMGYMLWWWHEEGSTVKELVLFIVLDLILSGVAGAAAVRVTAISQTRWVIGLVQALPRLMLVISIGLFVADMLWFRQSLNSLTLEEGGEEK